MKSEKVKNTPSPLRGEGQGEGEEGKRNFIFSDFIKSNYPKVIKLYFYNVFDSTCQEKRADGRHLPLRVTHVAPCLKTPFFP